MRTIIYIDGFNLYYNCLKKNPQYKWLDLHGLFRQLLNPENDIIEIKYFTARVKPLPNDQEIPIRQETYLRALKETTPNITIEFGKFDFDKKYLPLVERPEEKSYVIVPKEKKSDVNLAVQMVNDAWLDKYDCAVIASNDSDMKEAMKSVQQNHPNKIIGLITPGEDTNTSKDLLKHATFVRTIRNSLLAKSQLPDKIPYTNIKKPDSWA